MYGRDSSIISSNPRTHTGHDSRSAKEIKTTTFVSYRSTVQRNDRVCRDDVQSVVARCADAERLSWARTGDPRTNVAGRPWPRPLGMTVNVPTTKAVDLEHESEGRTMQCVFVFNPPPSWPKPPKGWAPPLGWAPGPDWPPLPFGWQLFTPIRRFNGLIRTGVILLALSCILIAVTNNSIAETVGGLAVWISFLLIGAGYVRRWLSKRAADHQYRAMAAAQGGPVPVWYGASENLAALSASHSVPTTAF
jgi:hypothetical protein